MNPKLVIRMVAVARTQDDRGSCRDPEWKGAQASCLQSAIPRDEEGRYLPVINSAVKRPW